jgi:hypothetical protein
MNRTESRPAQSPEPASDDVALPSNLPPCEDRLAFEPVPLRYRTDGLTPEKQRAYVEALADCGVAREAAARIRVSEQSINRVRRRSDAESFDRACEAAHMFGARRLRSVAFERAVEGILKGHYYRGERVSEERVYDNRLLTYLLGKVEHLLQPPREAKSVCDHWEPYMDALEQGLPPPDLNALRREARSEITGYELSEDEEGIWWTHFPPPEGFDGEEQGEYGDPGYKRTLSPREQEVLDSDLDQEFEEERSAQAARRDRYFGFAGDGISSPGEAEPYEASEPSVEEDRAEGPIEYKSMEPPHLSQARSGKGFEPSSPPYPHRPFRSIPEPARLWGKHGEGRCTKAAEAGAQADRLGAARRHGRLPRRRLAPRPLCLAPPTGQRRRARALRHSLRALGGADRPGRQDRPRHL